MADSCIDHSCDHELRASGVYDPFHCKDGQEWTCSCGKTWRHCCDEAEGCFWYQHTPQVYEAGDFG